jgi:hypothetical protein
MGSFFTNFHVRSEAPDNVRAALLPLVKARAYVSPPANGWVTIYDEASDDQDESIICKVAEGLSKKLRTTVVAFLVHDSDVAMYWLYRDGELADEFNSAPDYFGQSVSKTTLARVRGKSEVLRPLCVEGATMGRLEAVLHPAGGQPLMAEDTVTDIAELLGIDAVRATMGFRYFEEEGEEVLPDISEFQPIGKNAEPKTPKQRASATTDTEGGPPNLFAAAVGMLTQRWGLRQQMESLWPGGQAKLINDDMLIKLAERFDRSAKDILKHDSVQGHPTFDELKEARDRGPEALAEMLAQRVPDQIIDIAVGCAANASNLFIAALLKHGLNPNGRSSHGITPLAAAERHGENSTVYQLLKSAQQ